MHKVLSGMGNPKELFFTLTISPSYQKSGTVFLNPNTQLKGYPIT
jgi:hypothetical protein